MSKPVIKISVQEEMQNMVDAMRKVTSAIFKKQPGTATSIKAKRKSAQFTFKLTASNDKRSLESQGRRQILSKVFARETVRIENTIRQALEAVIIGLVGAGSANIRVFNRSLGSAKPRKDIDNAPFARFIKSKKGAGEIGLPDPNESLRNLKIALSKAITVDVIVRKNGPQIKFKFDQARLLKLTPHPDRLKGGSNATFFSWLSLVTGPDFSSGTPGFALVTVKDLRQTLSRSGSIKGASKASSVGLKRIEITESLIRSSRTRGNAGELAAIMLSTRSKKGRQSAAQSFGGKTDDYNTSSRFDGFWDKYWIDIKLELATWSKRVMSATVRSLLR